LPGDTHKPTHGLNQEIITGPVRVRAILAKSGDRAVDEFGVDLLQAVIIQAIAFEAPDLEVFKDNIRLCDQFSDQFLTFGMGDIDRKSSPDSGRSILITSAPRSPRICPAQGPASTLERSRTRK
jgi:hypothetical protein